jgi:serine/threonine protein phosphatase PrpC
MEDAHIAKEITLADKSKGMLFGVFDGHGGQEVALHAEKEFQKIL